MANRKQRRNTKNKNKAHYNDEYTQSTKTIIITLLVVIVVFGLFYFITTLVNNSKRGLNTVEPTEEEVSIQYEEILAGMTFDMNQDEYYVLFYDFDGPDATYLGYLFDQYASIEGNYIYEVDLGSGFNKNIISKDTNSKAQKASDLKVKDPTLIKIENGKNVEYVEGASQLIANVIG